MSKYINVNILMETLKKCRDGWSKVNNGYLAVNEVIENVEALPTVDAITVEWIENYLRNYRYMAPIEKNFVREMIKAWSERKEE